MSSRLPQSATFSRRRVTAWGLAFFMIGAGAYGALLTFESFGSESGCCGATKPHPNPIQAERLVLAHDPQGLNSQLQAQAARAVLASRPIDHTGWMRLAYAESLEAGRLTPSGLAALRNSYTMAAYAGRNAGWRSAFALQNWPALDLETQQFAIAEFIALKADWPRLQAQKGHIVTVTLPIGRAIAVGHGLAQEEDFSPAPEPKLRR